MVHYSDKDTLVKSFTLRVLIILISDKVNVENEVNIVPSPAGASAESPRQHEYLDVPRSEFRSFGVPVMFILHSLKWC